MTQNPECGGHVPAASIPIDASSAFTHPSSFTRLSFPTQAGRLRRGRGGRRLMGEVLLLLWRPRSSSEIHAAGARELLVFKGFGCRLCILTPRDRVVENDPVIAVAAVEGYRFDLCIVEAAADAVDGHIARGRGVYLKRSLCISTHSHHRLDGKGSSERGVPTHPSRKGTVRRRRRGLRHPWCRCRGCGRP